MELDALTTPALVLDADVVEANLAAMSAALPGSRLRPHVKAHKCTELARMQAAAGHPGFTCATVREAEGMARAGLGDDLLIANELFAADRVGALVAAGHRVTLAVDSPETVQAARDGGVREVLVDVDVGLRRCGIRAEQAGWLAEQARHVGLVVRGVMGYEGHAVGLHDRDERARAVRRAAARLATARDAVGGDVVSAGGTGSYDLNAVATEIQAGSYVLMDTAYGQLGLPFGQALTVLATVISVNRSARWVVVDCGLKALGMDHGNPSVPGGEVWSCSDEHLVWSPVGVDPLPAVGDRIHVIPGHCDPTVAYHEWLHVARDRQVLDRWRVDLRGW